jgi:hypothetical protein
MIINVPTGFHLGLSSWLWATGPPCHDRFRRHGLRLLQERDKHGKQGSLRAQAPYGAPSIPPVHKNKQRFRLLALRMPSLHLGDRYAHCIFSFFSWEFFSEPEDSGAVSSDLGMGDDIKAVYLYCFETKYQYGLSCLRPAPSPYDNTELCRKPGMHPAVQNTWLMALRLRRKPQAVSFVCCRGVGTLLK